MLKIFLITALLVVSSCSIATKALYKAPDAKVENVKNGNYTLDKSHASIIFKVKHLGFSNYTGRFNNFDASLNFDEKNPLKSEVTAKIDITSIDSNNDELKQKLLGKEFFYSKTLPYAYFKSTKIEKTSENRGKIYGDLTLVGVKKPIVLDTKFNASGIHPITKETIAGFSAKAKIKRSDFGVNAFIPAVADEVILDIEVEFIKKK
jgi:polyisoprenoid-binding protein YceI